MVDLVVSLTERLSRYEFNKHRSGFQCFSMLLDAGNEKAHLHMSPHIQYLRRGRHFYTTGT
jgi:hypothetical protein